MAFSRLRSIRLSGPLVAGSFLLLGFLFFGSVAPVEAANSCSFTRSGNFTLTATECSITSGTIDGIDAGNLIIGPNKTITIETGAKLVINPGSEINLDAGSQLIIDKPSSASGAVVKGNICVKDADADGYVDYNSTILHPTAGRQPTYTFTNSSCTAPYIRKGSAVATFLTEFDCFDTTNGKRQHSAGFPAAPAGDGLTWSGATVVNNVGTCGQYVAGKQRRLLRWTVTNTSIAYCGIADRSIWEDYDDSLVCCTTGYRDYDKDGYGAGTQGCYNPDAAYNVVANNDDCDDGNNAIIVGSTRSVTSCYTDAACGTAGTQTCQSGGGGNWATTTACSQSAAACCSNGALRPSTYVCSPGTLDNPASGSCRRQTTDYRCTGTTATCGTTNPVARYEYASTNGYTWNQSTQTWVSASCSIYASAGAASSCSGQQPQRPVYGCTAGANTSYTGSVAATCSYGSVCGGGENSRCVSGSCSNLCSDSVDNDGDSFKDAQDTECGAGGCQQCLSGACCNSTTACYTSGSTCRASAGVCDIAESCSGSSASCPVDSFRANSYKCYDGSPTGSSGTCRTTDTDQYCSGVAAACNGSTVPIYGYASTNGQVWNASSWINASYAGVNAGVTGPTCNGQTPRYAVYGCTAGVNSTYLYTYYNLSACSGAENNRCTGGSCQELCSDGVDNDGNGLTDGADPACPTNQCTSGECCDTSTGQFRASSYVCRASGGTCDIQETCTGASASCPADSVRANSYKCYDGAMTGLSGTCRTSDTDQYCSGSGYLCNGSTSTTYGYASTNGQVWNSSSWVNANYNGSTGVYSLLTGPTCNGQTPRYAVYGCTAGVNSTYLYTYYNLSACSGGENNMCVDGSATCVNKCVGGYYPADNDGDGYTDTQDPNCGTGGCGQCTSGTCCNTSTGCFTTPGTTCRASAGGCDITETCSGSSSACPADSFQPNTYACRTPSGACDAIEMCTGTGASCPADAKLPAGTVCRAAGTLPCNPAETCDGSNNVCPGETNTDGILCASSRGVCENDYYCSSGTCPSSPSYFSSSTRCSFGDFSGSSGSCILTANDTYCSGSSYLCNGTTNTRYQYASYNGQVWNGSSWVYAAYPGTYSLLTGPDYCNSQQRQYSVYGCTAGSASNYLYTRSSYGLSACSGIESNMCQVGSCVDKCVGGYYPVDNDGDGYTDTQDPNCGTGGCGQCTSGTCCNTSTGCYQPSTYVCNSTTWGSWTGTNGACQISRSRGLYKCLGTSGSCPTGVNGTETEYSYIASGYVWWNSASIYTSSTAYCGLNTPSSSCYCSGQQPMCMVKACNGSGSCSVDDDTHFAASGSPCNGTTNTCSNGVCVGCTSGYRDYDKDGYGTGSYSCCTASSSYNVVANNTDCNDSSSSYYRYLTGYRDADLDTYTTGSSQSVCSGASLPSGWRAAVNGSDCNDSDASVYQNLTAYQDSDADTYTVGSAQSLCSGAYLSSGWASSAKGNDCNDSVAAFYQYYTGYTDSDNDGYRPSGYSTNTTICGGSSFPSGWGWTQNTSGVDCLDSNASVKPGQTYWFTSAASGAPLSGWDYNCSGAIEYQYSAATAGQCTNTIGNSYNVLRVGDIQYSMYCGFNYCGLLYNGGTSFSCHSGGTTTGCIAPYNSCTPSASAAARH